MRQNVQKSVQKSDRHRCAIADSPLCLAAGSSFDLVHPSIPVKVILVNHAAKRTLHKHVCAWIDVIGTTVRIAWEGTRLPDRRTAAGIRHEAAQPSDRGIRGIRCSS